MTKQLINILEQKRFKVLGHAQSLAEARDYAESLLVDSTKQSVTEALDYYHNTLIEEIKGEVTKL